MLRPNYFSGPLGQQYLRSPSYGAAYQSVHHSTAIANFPYNGGAGVTPVYQPPQQPALYNLAPQPPQQTQPEQPVNYRFDRKADKIVFHLKENTKVPAFNKYFRDVFSYNVGLFNQKENTYTKALVLEQKIKAHGFINGGDKDTNTLKSELSKNLKDSTGTINNKITKIFDENKNDPGFQESIKATLEEGIAIRANSDSRASEFRRVLLELNLTKKDAGQIAKAISILDDHFLAKSIPATEISAHISKLVEKHLSHQPPPSASPSQPQKATLRVDQLGRKSWSSSQEQLQKGGNLCRWQR